ncbi:28S ribosomal protein S29, mitochondrial isoform X2 [Xenopus laevis]|uniref:Small ribosomal subunit protein mS29 n=1 Tax=Xenopus laevis TaxID=8355 RepID=A0A8J1LJN4_XENLA|nr:28S ribosomal protein S29, mitochondrial isoform X2 [Xenopus laevis]
MSPSGILVRRLHRNLTQNLVGGHIFPSRLWSSAASSPAQDAPREVFRTSESDPGQHTEQHEGQFYSLSAQDVRAIFPQGLPWCFQQQSKTFNETCVMVRPPAVELIRYLSNKSHLSQPAVRYVLYGKRGTGKSLTLCHILHYCYTRGWLLLQVPDAHVLVKNCKELMPSTYHKDRFDQPLEASNWLKNFKATNEQFLKQIQTQQRYVWSKREATEEGRPLGEVVDQGLTRVKSASDAVGVVLKELKRQSGGGAFRMLVSMDGVNALWGRTTIKKEDKSWVSAEELTLVHNMRKMVQNDWEGFDALDPFVPVQVTNYSDKEFESCYQYYMERKWLQHHKALTPEGKEELRFLSDLNPKELEKICAFL